MSNLENGARNLNTVFHHIYEVMETSRKMFNFRVRLMKCRTTEACKVGAKPDLTWKVEVSYPLTHPDHGTLPPEDDALEIAKMLFPNRPECQTLF